MWCEVGVDDRDDTTCRLDTQALAHVDKTLHWGRGEGVVVATALRGERLAAQARAHMLTELGVMAHDL